MVGLLWDLRIKPLNYEMYVHGGILWSVGGGGERCRTRFSLRALWVGGLYNSKKSPIYC